jgi:hypothetical protein
MCRDGKAVWLERNITVDSLMRVSRLNGSGLCKVLLIKCQYPYEEFEYRHVINRSLENDSAPYKAEEARLIRLQQQSLRRTCRV